MTIPNTNRPVIHKGLNGVVVDSTSISDVDPTITSLTYRGYPVQELATECSFEEVAYLLWNGELPDPGELSLFSQRERTSRSIDPRLQDLIFSMPENCHPMDVLRTAISWLGARDQNHDVHQSGLSLLAKLPTVVAYDLRRRRGADVIAPSRDRGIASNFLYMCFGDDPESPATNFYDVEAFDRSLTLYAEHSFNASTFTARVISSTLSDVYSAITGAVGALKGPLHGGANEAVMEAMLEIGDPDRAADWVRAQVDAGNKIMGFGHRVYRTGDSRVPTMEESMRRIAASHGGETWVQMYDAMAEAMEERTGILPNLDFPAGPLYHMLGIDIPFFTPIFVLARTVGWTAHIAEQYADNSLIRPLSNYVGPGRREINPQAAA